MVGGHAEAAPALVEASRVALGPGPLDDVLRLEHLQLEGTHNSYHRRPLLRLPPWDYEHAPLGEQLRSQGVRKVELDLWWNAQRGAFEVYHLPFVDERTSCRRLVNCLRALRSWSDAHPGHAPLFVQLEPKDGFDPERSEARLEAMEAEILSVWSRDRLLTPDLVRGSSRNLSEAVAERGWPSLANARGRALFFLDCDRPLAGAYTDGHRSLRGRIAFVGTREASPYAAVRILNDPVADAAEIRDAVRAGQLVRTRAHDAETFAAALASGAHIVSTDFPAPVPEEPFHAALPGERTARCNPVTAPQVCYDGALERAARRSQGDAANGP